MTVIVNAVRQKEMAAMTMTGAEIGGTGENYALDKSLDVRLRTRHAMYKTAAQVAADMVEEDARAKAGTS